jgi:hypothetical protein
MTRAVPAGLLAAMLWLALFGSASAADTDLHSALAFLRAGAQAQAAEHLTRYRDGVADPDIRRSVDRALVLLRRPLGPEVREFVASTLEDSVRAKTTPRLRGPLASHAARVFPVFP